MAEAPTQLAELRIELRAQVVGNDNAPQVTVGTITVPVTARVRESTDDGAMLDVHPSVEQIQVIVEELASRLSLVPVQA